MCILDVNGSRHSGRMISQLNHAVTHIPPSAATYMTCQLCDGKCVLDNINVYHTVHTFSRYLCAFFKCIKWPE